MIIVPSNAVVEGKITAQLYRGVAATSRLIRWYGGKGAMGFSHIDAVLPAWTGREGQLLGARFKGGVQIRPAGYLPSARATRFTIDCAPQQESLFYEFLFNQIGKPYDWRAILAFVVDRDWRCPDAWYCSELFSAALEHCGRIPRLFAPESRLTPNDDALLLSALA